ncbi:uncharacterized protein [Gossypium hirsutum]|uniref:DUF4283 domain-containing protein n=1 Tax=Gossypium hirsutum TaxID=3635 RepID=A0A1U8IAE7_GOSHI|nr:uncharacterized protein LOC107892690 [Gossypium hirsutum]
MSRTVIVKLLGSKIGFNALSKKITLLWKPKGSFQLMDLDNEFYLVQFDDTDDYKNVLTGGPWVVYGNYLTVRPWSLDFSSTNADMSIQVVWIRLPGLLEGFYSKVLLRAIGQIIGPVIKLNINTNLERKGQFTRLAVCVDLQKLLISKVRINDQLQRVEYESLRNVCFQCGLYSHSSEGCIGTKGPQPGKENESLGIVGVSSGI